MFKHLLKSKGYTQIAFANLIGVTQSTISQWSNGLTKPQTKDLSKIAKALGVTVDELLCCFEKER